MSQKPPQVAKKESQLPNPEIGELDPIFLTENMDFVEWTLRNLPEKFDQNVLYERAVHHSRHLEKTNNELSAKVMQNYNAFVQAMSHIHDLGQNLETSAFISKTGRDNLREAKEELAKRVLEILAKYRRKQIYQQIYSGFISIKNVLTTEQALNKSLDQGDYTTAIEQSLECHETISNFKQFSCVGDLKTRLQDIDNTLQEKIEQSLKEVCHKFNPDGYRRVLLAYKMLGPAMNVLNKLESLYMESINKTTKSIIISMCPEEIETKPEQLQKLNFKDLCGLLNESRFIPCFFGILEITTDFMHGHYSMVKWHEDREKEGEKDKFFRDVKTGLLNFTKKMWEDIQQRVTKLLTSSKLEKFKIEEFLLVLSSINKFIAIGKEFSGDDSNNLRGSITKQIEAYFHTYHRDKMEYLGTLVENESWQKCSIPNNFSLFGLKEYRTFLDTLHNNETSAKQTSYLAAMKKDGNPFSVTAMKDKKILDAFDENAETEENLLETADGIDEISGELTKAKKENHDKNDGMFCATTVFKLVRFCGEYLNMMKVLSPIADTVFASLVQMIEYYLFTMYSFFGDKDRERDKDGEELISTKLTSAFNKIRKQFDSPEAIYQLPTLSIDLFESSDFYALGNRMVAIESLYFIQTTMNNLKKYFQELLPYASGDKVTEFYSTDIDTLPDFANFLLRSFISRSSNWEGFLKTIENTKWDLKDIPEGFVSNPYTNHYFKEIGEPFFKKLNETAKKEAFPQRITTKVGESHVLNVFETLVEGYARARKCSQQGRTVMKLDFVTITAGIEKLAPYLKPLSHVRYVETFISAFYLGEIDILPWCKEHLQEYTLKQQLNLLTICQGAQAMKAQGKAAVKMAIEENYKRKVKK